MKKLCTLLTLGFLFFFAFAKAQNDSTKVRIEVPDIVLKAHVGEPVKMGDISIKLLEVLEDSRCPSDVDCIWQGQVKLAVEVIAGKTKKVQEITFAAGTTPVLFHDNGTKIFVRGITPYPKTSRKISLSDYVMLVDKRG